MLSANLPFNCDILKNLFKKKKPTHDFEVSGFWKPCCTAWNIPPLETGNNNNDLTMVKTFMNLRLHIKILKRHKGTKSKAKKKTYLKFEYCKMISNKGLNNFDSNLQSYTQGLSYLWSNPNKSINRKNIPNPFALFPAFPKTSWFSFPIFCPYYLIMLILLYMAIIMILARVCAVISTCLICCIKKSVRLLKESIYLKNSLFYAEI